MCVYVRACLRTCVCLCVTVDLQKRCTMLLAAVLTLFLLLPGCMGQRFPQQVPLQPLQPFIPVPEFFCQWTPRAPAAPNQQQCIAAFGAFNLRPIVNNFCLSVGQLLHTPTLTAFDHLELLHMSFSRVASVSQLLLYPMPERKTQCQWSFDLYS